MKNTENFRSFLDNKMAIKEDAVELPVLHGTLARTLGNELSKLGWVTGSKGSGIVSMVDEDEGDFDKAVKVINNWLKKMSFSALKKGKVSGELSTEYRGATLSIVKATDTFKVLITK